SPSTRIAWLVRVVPARGSTRRPALMTTVTDGTAAAAGATGACAVSGTTAAASALRAAAGRTLLVMTTSEETTKEWRLGKLCTSREVGGGGVARVTREGARAGHLRRRMGDTEGSGPAGRPRVSVLPPAPASPPLCIGFPGVHWA